MLTLRSADTCASFLTGELTIMSYQAGLHAAVEAFQGNNGARATHSAPSSSCQPPKAGRLSSAVMICRRSSHLNSRLQVSMTPIAQKSSHRSSPTQLLR